MLSDTGTWEGCGSASCPAHSGTQEMVDEGIWGVFPGLALLLGPPCNQCPPNLSPGSTQGGLDPLTSTSIIVPVRGYEHRVPSLYPPPANCSAPLLPSLGTFLLATSWPSHSSRPGQV